MLTDRKCISRESRLAAGLAVSTSLIAYLLMWPTPVSAQVSVDGGFVSVEATSRIDVDFSDDVVDADERDSINLDIQSGDVFLQPRAEARGFAGGNGDFPTSGAIASARVLRLSSSMNSETGGLSVRFDGDVEATASELFPEDIDTLNANARVIVELRFTVSGGPATLAVSGGLVEATRMEQASPSGQFGLEDFPPEPFAEASVDPAGPEMDTAEFANSFTLEPGTYLICVDIESGRTEGVGWTGSARVRFDMEITPMDTAEDVFWTANDGDYDEAENWEPMQVPGSSQTAIFDRDTAYTVNITSEESGRAMVERGDVLFSGTGYTLSGGDEANPSLIVGGTAVDFASLDADIELSTQHAIIGSGANTMAEMGVSTSPWSNAGNLVVGGNGLGTLRVFDMGSVTTGALVLGESSGGNGLIEVSSNAALLQNPALMAGNTAIGLAGSATLNVTNSSIATDEFLVGVSGMGTVEVDSSIVRTGAVELGSEEGSSGSANVFGAIADEVEWVATGLTVGNVGRGELTIEDNYVIRVDDDIEMGLEPAGLGIVNVSGGTTEEMRSILLSLNGTIAIGVAGSANLDVLGGAAVAADSIHIGVAPVGELGGLVRVSGASGPVPSTLTAFEDLRVGLVGNADFEFPTTAALAVEEGAVVECRNCYVGEEGARVFLTVRTDSKIDALQDFFSSAADATMDPPEPLNEVRILNEGLIKARRITFETGTTLLGGGVYSADEFIDYAGALNPGPEDSEESKGRTEFAVVTFDGDFLMERGSINLDVGGPNTAQADGVVITGDAQITGGEVHFNFVNGYLPQTGDQLAFLQVDGAATMDNLTYTYAGAAEGFDFDVTEQDGMLVFDAQNDAQPDPDGNGNAGPRCAANGTGPAGGGASGDVLVLLAVALALTCGNWASPRFLNFYRGSRSMHATASRMVS